jgi:septum formation topological specificity factor MinE
MNLEHTDKGFQFHKCYTIVELTGDRARDIKEFVEILRYVDQASIFGHTHRTFFKHHFARDLYSNDFAYWISEVLQERRLGERVASIDLTHYQDIEQLRQDLILILESYIANQSQFRSVPKGEEFHFTKVISLIQPTNYVAHSIYEFLDCLKSVDISSLYYHFFEADLRLKRPTNDFSFWIEDSLDGAELARKIHRINPYMSTLEELRERIVRVIEAYLKSIAPVQHQAQKGLSGGR